ncbi:DUF3500 domain-containing protein [Microbacterium oryzae]|uniref:DUF3500 domain-containing protein n=1 Tax=Microbacterium oryzae TaxID=743009 RepID=UPI0025B15D19|nr:DUF3500 domain-containing protein [Microbacterium oryzae]MDN3310343.1 DUF3500 domain-containing protein [Microbacterium oryzae]
MTDDDVDGFFSTARLRGRAEAVQLGDESYREHLLDLEDPKLAAWRGLDREEFARRRVDNPFVQGLLADWNALYREPFRGITTDGAVREGLYPLADGGEPDVEMGRAVARLLDVLAPERLAAVRYPLDAREWRAWSNPEFAVHRVGVRLEDLDADEVTAVLAVVEASLSPAGFARVRETMALNGYLGELVDLPQVMNERSYSFALFGEPGTGEPWGWQLFGHHLALNVVEVAGRHVIAPVFIGAEPALSDDARAPLFAERERLALELAASLTPAQRRAAVVYGSVLDPDMPEGRVHPADERHVAGAFRDNRVVPYEGVVAGDLDDAQRDLLRRIVADAHLLLKDGQRAATLAEFDAHLDETHLAWYGATDGSQPIYFRVHSPVLIAELDDHAGVWLANRLPARFHVHTTLRHPNGNDYGRAWIRQWRERTGSPSENDF